MILNIYKEANMTSHDVVYHLTKIFHTKKIGHTGTLDPMAEGVLICCVGSDTKLASIITSTKKEYIATIKLGIKTDTGDITGRIIATKDYLVTQEQIINTLNSFLGSSLQEVPAYSAIQINGKKLYEYARSNKVVNLPKRNINIYQIELLSYQQDLIKFKVMVSKGTYIRSLINDICEKLNTVGTMASLIRTKQGEFSYKNSYRLNDIQNDNYQIISYDEIFKEYYKIDLTAKEYFKVKNGQQMECNCNADKIIFMYQKRYIALYKRANDYYVMDILIEKS